jgi:tripartite-type tricarboxylate transporter receptor subunit TctC
MKLPRRDFLYAAAAAALPAISRTAWALDYPVRPVRLVVGYPPGVGPEIIARLVCQRLSERLGQQFVVENRPGAGTNIATEFVAKAAPDGYTLLLVGAANTINVAFYDNLDFDFIRDIAPVARITGNTPFVMLVNPSLPAMTVPDFIAYAKANPGKINMGSQGNGTASHVFGELFKMMAGVDLFHVPYHGEPEAQADLMAGRAQVMFDPIISCLGDIKAGKLRALAVTTPKRVDSLPGVPTVGESVPGYEVTGGLGVGAPRDTPADIIDKLNQAIGAGINDDKVRGHLIDLGEIPITMSPAEYRQQIAKETDKWAKVIKFAGIKLG